MYVCTTVCCVRTCWLTGVPRQGDGAAPVPKRAEASRHAAEEELERAHDDREHLERERERDRVRGKERKGKRERAFETKQKVVHTRCACGTTRRAILLRRYNE